MKTRFSLHKLIFTAVLLLLVLGAAGQAVAYEIQAQVTAPAIVNANSVAVHANADAQATIVDIVNQNQVVTMLGRNTDASWVYVRTPSGILGWMRPQSLTYTINLFDLTAVSVTPTPGSATATPTPVTQAINFTGVVNTGALNVRSGPGVQFGRIAAVYFGDGVILLGRNADATWLYIQTASTVRGWVNARYITPSNNIGLLPVVDASVSTPTPGGPILTPTPIFLTPLPTAVPGPTTVPNTGVVNTGNLNVRGGPGVGYARVSSVSLNAVVSLLGRNLDSSWAHIATGTHEGWVNARYLTSSSSIGNLPVTAQTGTGYVATGNLNIRTAPGATGTGISTVSAYGSAVVLLGRTSDNTWLMLRASDGKEGWANAGYISTGMNINQLPLLAGAVPGQTAVPVAPPPPVSTGSVTSLRACPNLSCAVTGSVYSGLAVTATGRTADSTWIYVVLSNGQQGWIQAQYVALSISVSSLPVRNP